MPTSMPAGGSMGPKWMLKPWANMGSWPVARGGREAREMVVEAGGEQEQLAGSQVGRDVRVVDALLGRVRDEDHDREGRLRCLGDGRHAAARFGRAGAALRGLFGAAPHGHPGAAAA